MHHGLMRGENTRTVELPDMFLRELHHEGVGDATEYCLTSLINHGKTNQFNKDEYAYAIRYKDSELCLLGYLAAWFFWRWEVETEAFPDYTNKKNWYFHKVFRVDEHHLTDAMQYATQAKYIVRAYKKIGLTITSVVHGPRKTGPNHAEAAGAAGDQIRRAGRWSRGDALSGKLSSA